MQKGLQSIDIAVVVGGVFHLLLAELSSFFLCLFIFMWKKLEVKLINLVNFSKLVIIIVARFSAIN